MERRIVELTDGVRISCQLSADPGAPTMVLPHALGERAASWAEAEPGGFSDTVLTWTSRS